MGELNRSRRERDHWDHVIPTPDEVIAEFHRGPDANVALMLSAVQPQQGQRVLDIACGGGVTTAWLASRGARVTGIDISPKSIDVAREVLTRLGLRAEFVVADLSTEPPPAEDYDGVVGRYALHHLDVQAMAPNLANAVTPGGTGAFVETMGTSAILRFARDHLVGRFGIPRIGTLDEHPLVKEDLAAIREAFGSLNVVTAEYHFWAIFERQIFLHRWPSMVRLSAWMDNVMMRIPIFKGWSYHQVLIAKR